MEHFYFPSNMAAIIALLQAGGLQLFGVLAMRSQEFRPLPCLLEN